MFIYNLKAVFNFAIRKKTLGTSVSKIRRLSSSDFFYFKSLNINMEGKNYE